MSDDVAVSESAGVLSLPDACRRLRLFWGAAVLSVVVTAGVLAVVIQNRSAPAPAPGSAPGITPAMFGPVRIGVFALVALVVLMGVGYFTRLQTYKLGWQGFSVAPAAYLRGNILLFALLETAALLALVLGAFVGDSGACFGVATAAFVALLINFPGGGPMETRQPRL